MALLQSVSECRFIDQFAARTVHQTHSALHLLQRLGVDHARGLRSEADVQRQIIRRRVDFLQLGDGDTLLLGHRDRDERIVRDNLHPEGSRPPRDFHSDSPQTYNAQRLAPQFRSLQRFLLPLAGMHQLIRPAEMARQGQHHRQGMFRDCDRIRSGRVHDRDALPRRGFQIDVVDSHSRAPDHAQLSRLSQQLGIHLHRRADDQRVR